MARRKDCANKTAWNTTKKRENNFAGVTHTSPKLLHNGTTYTTLNVADNFLPVFVSCHVLLYSKSVKMEDEVALDIREVLGFQNQLSSPLLSHNESVF